MSKYRAVQKRVLQKSVSPAERKLTLSEGEYAMATTEATTEGARLTVQFTDSALKTVGGSNLDAFNLTLYRETAACIWPLRDGKEGVNARLASAYAALAAFKPRDEIEAMIAAQAVALHFGAMECLRRAMIADQPAEFAARFRKDGANLARAFTEMLDALDRRRGKVQQTVRVERVVVNEGGQAIVGAVSTGAKDGGG